MCYEKNYAHVHMFVKQFFGKLYTILFACYGEFENLCFAFIAPTNSICASHAFVYDVVDINKIVSFNSTAFIPIWASCYIAKIVSSRLICLSMV